MATPYLQLRKDEVPSTQDLARAEVGRLPVVVIAQRQSAGRGRTGGEWVTAPRALAVSIAFRGGQAPRPWSLIAGVAAVRALAARPVNSCGVSPALDTPGYVLGPDEQTGAPSSCVLSRNADGSETRTPYLRDRPLADVSLKWPNDIVIGDKHLKTGGILVELSETLVVAGLGLNLWWPEAPEGVAALYDDDPGPDFHARIAGVWAAELLELIGEESWPIDEYRGNCVTLGREVTWDPGGSGRAVDITGRGELIVEDDTGLHTIASGAVHHVRG